MKKLFRNGALVCCFAAAGCAFGESSSGRSVEEGTVYVPIGKRDPFKRPVASDGTNRDVSALNPLEKFAIDQFQLRAILRGTATAQAMFEDPEGRVHILSEGTLLGRERGTISRILNREVIVTERTVNYLGVTSLFERVLSLPADDEVDQASPVNKAGKGPAGGGAPAAAGGGNGAAAPNVEKKVIRGVADERAAAPPRAAAAPPPPPPPGPSSPNISRVGGLSIGSPPPPPPPAAGAAGTVRGGEGKGLTY